MGKRGIGSGTGEETVAGAGTRRASAVAADPVSFCPARHRGRQAATTSKAAAAGEKERERESERSFPTPAAAAGTPAAAGAGAGAVYLGGLQRL